MSWGLGLIRERRGTRCGVWGGSRGLGGLQEGMIAYAKGIVGAGGCGRAICAVSWALGAVASLAKG